MSERYVQEYGGFILRCAPEPTADGRFIPRVDISSAAGGDGIGAAQAFPQKPCDSERDAANVGLAEGRQWVDREPEHRLNDRMIRETLTQFPDERGVLIVSRAKCPERVEIVEPFDIEERARTGSLLTRGAGYIAVSGYDPGTDTMRHRVVRP
jgi:hypothetical protein